MSLLNDALRDLEKRERQPGAGNRAVPAGLRADGRRRTPVVILAGGPVVALVLAAAGGWFWLGAGKPSAEPESQAVIASQGNVDSNASAETVKRVESAVTGETPDNPGSAGKRSPLFDPVPVVIQPRARLAKAVQPAASTQDAEGTGDESAFGERAGRETAPNETVQTRAAPVDQQPASDRDGENPAPPAEPTSVRELTPREKDRRLARKLETLLDSGQRDTARERLQSRLTTDSGAPRARAVMARHHLARGDAQQARRWLPDSVVERYPALRLLRARAAKQEQGAAEALAWLRRDPPAVEDNPDYHTMMAALYQQSDQPREAAQIWVGLIEMDDSRARWWAGLGIALESQGRSDRARAAYRQAAKLPGLPQQLRRYVEQRLTGEQG